MPTLSLCALSLFHIMNLSFPSFTRAACATQQNVRIEFDGLPDDAGSLTNLNCQPPTPEDSSKGNFFPSAMFFPLNHHLFSHYSDLFKNPRTGVGTPSNPLTFSAAAGSFLPCEIIYIPYLRKFALFTDSSGSYKPPPPAQKFPSFRRPAPAQTIYGKTTT